MNHEELAREYFRRGYNCAQSVFLAFSDLTQIEEDQAVRLASSFGAGMGGLRETCGAVSSMLMVTGLLYGYADPENLEIKKEHYARVQELAAQFTQQFGTMNCRELLKKASCNASSTPSQRTAEYYAKRPCEAFVGGAAALLDRYIQAHPL